MDIFSLFILEESGVCLYHKNFSDETKDLNIDLITPFFSAIFTFSQKVVDRRLEVLEMGDIRFVFKKERGYIFVILASSQMNLLFLNTRLDNIKKLFFQFYNELFDEKSYRFNASEKYDNLIDMVIYGRDEKQKVEKSGIYQKIINYFKDLISKREIIGAALLTTKGALIYSSVSSDLLQRIMKELEIRFTTGTFDVPELFYTLPDGKKVCEKIITYKNFISLLLVVQFPSSYKLGMVDYTTETIVETLKNFL